MPLIYIDRENGRVYLKGYRIHHGLAGAALALGGFGLMALGVYLADDDWQDKPWLPKQELK